MSGHRVHVYNKFFIEFVDCGSERRMNNTKASLCECECPCHCYCGCTPRILSRYYQRELIALLLLLRSALACFRSYLDRKYDTVDRELTRLMREQITASGVEPQWWNFYEVGKPIHDV